MCTASTPGRQPGTSRAGHAQVPTPDETLIAASCRRIEEAYEEPSLEALARAAGLSRWQFHRLFRRVTGLTPKAYAAATRARRLRASLAARECVTDAMLAAGYGSSSRLHAAAQGRLGMAPSRFRAGGAGTRIRFAVGECSLGSILVAQSERGLCAIFLGDDPDELVRALQDQFHAAELVGGDAGFEAVVAQVVGFVEAPELGLGLPLDIRGSVFQERVWRALMEVPPGETISYAELAGRIGQPAAVRAVAGACAANRLAVAIPCHRVVRSDGAVSGYRWGVARKRALLEREAGR